MTRAAAPTLELERSLLQTLPAGALVAGMDEVGRGALAGPVAVGVAVVSAASAEAPSTVRDSKLLRPAVRQQLVPQIRSWAVGSAVGMASPAEIDALGIVGALRLAGRRALESLEPTARPDLVLLDGSHDWLSAPSDLLSLAADVEAGPAWDGPVRTQVKGDMTCASIAGASVLAKVERDALMETLDAQHPAYGWARNKGYGAAAHRAALLERGVTEHHRRSWKLGLPS